MGLLSCDSRVLTKGKWKRVTASKFYELKDAVDVISFDFGKQEAFYTRAKKIQVLKDVVVVRIKTSKGDMKATPDKKIMTQRGWVEARDININDTLYTFVDFCSGQFSKTTYPKREQQIIERYARCVEPVFVLENKEEEKKEDVFDIEVLDHLCFFTDMVLMSQHEK